MRFGKYKIVIVLVTIFFLLGGFSVSGCSVDNDDPASLDNEKDEAGDEKEDELSGELHAPKYPDAEKVDLIENEEGEYMLYQTTDALEDVLAFYQDEFPDYYLTQKEELYYLAPIHMDDMQEKAEEISGEEVLLFDEEEGLVIIQIMRFNN